METLGHAVLQLLGLQLVYKAIQTITAMSLPPVIARRCSSAEAIPS
jgi:hypothetical protein